MEQPMSKFEQSQYLEAIVSFINSIGIECKLVSFEQNTFLPGICISAGSLIVDKDKLQYPGDLLHEAGHIAVEPAKSRHQLNGDMNECGQDDGQEVAAIAWSYAALKAIGLPAEVVFHEAGYRGSSQSLVNCFDSGGLYGQPLLSYFGMCKPLTHPDSFPKMERWLRL